MILLSIIVPIYNASKYIVKCVESFYHQNLNKCEFEVILVNDGSTDDTMLVLKKIRDKYQNVRVLSQCNSGQGVARNKALNLAKGENLLHGFYFKGS